jgi:hypothetical protein
MADGRYSAPARRLDMDKDRHWCAPKHLTRSVVMRRESDYWRFDRVGGFDAAALRRVISAQEAADSAAVHNTRRSAGCRCEKVHRYTPAE